MSKVVVHRFESYDITNDQMVKSRRYGTADAIKNTALGRILPNTQIEVDASELGIEIEGFTVRDYRPDSERAAPGGGFQTRVLKG
jgi:hypothetical protein